MMLISDNETKQPHEKTRETKITVGYAVELVLIVKTKNAGKLENNPRTNLTVGRRSWGMRGLDPLKICRRGQECVLTPPHLKCHIPSFKAVVG